MILHVYDVTNSGNEKTNNTIMQINKIFKDGIGLGGIFHSAVQVSHLLRALVYFFQLLFICVIFFVGIFSELDLDCYALENIGFLNHIICEKVSYVTFS